YHFLQQSHSTISQLKNNIKLFKQTVNNNRYRLINSDSAIQCMVLNSNETAKAISTELQNAGLDVRPILSPTVPAGSERIRICLHSFNTENEIILLADTINKFNDAR
ncbi:MAG: aminotransferase class I/II-fold pyridoxal phosphate-dependent enzyme, partial [Mucilaginibacter sp.]